MEGGKVSSLISQPAQPEQSPHTPSERALADLFAEVLRVERVGSADNFFNADTQLWSVLHRYHGVLKASIDPALHGNLFEFTYSVPLSFQQRFHWDNAHRLSDLNFKRGAAGFFCLIGWSPRTAGVVLLEELA
jgi:hypothetical protein